jgi:hypothetical protein
MMTLAELLQRAGELGDELTIYAEGGPDATPESRATAAAEPEDGSLPPEAEGLEYLLEADQVKEVIDVWSDWRGGAKPSATQRVEAVTYYAKNDTYLPA